MILFNRYIITFGIRWPISKKQEILLIELLRGMLHGFLVPLPLIIGAYTQYTVWLLFYPIFLFFVICIYINRWFSLIQIQKYKKEDPDVRNG